MGADDFAWPSTSLTKGNIVVHRYGRDYGWKLDSQVDSELGAFAASFQLDLHTWSGMFKNQADLMDSSPGQSHISSLPLDLVVSRSRDESPLPLRRRTQVLKSVETSDLEDYLDEDLTDLLATDQWSRPHD